MKQNRRFFLPYLLALAGLTAAFYVMSALCADRSEEHTSELQSQR